MKKHALLLAITLAAAPLLARAEDAGADLKKQIEQSEASLKAVRETLAAEREDAATKAAEMEKFVSDYLVETGRLRVELGTARATARAQNADMKKRLDESEASLKAVQDKLVAEQKAAEDKAKAGKPEDSEKK